MQISKSELSLLLQTLAYGLERFAPDWGLENNDEWKAVQAAKNKARKIVANDMLNELYIADILQEIYNEEINMTISWFWDEGIDIIIGDDANGIKAKSNFDTIKEAMRWLSKKIVELYPDSDFAKRRNA